MKTRKVVFLGDVSVGKTSIINKFLEKPISDDPTVGAKSISAEIPIGGRQSVRIKVWDTAGNEEFRCFTPIYVHGAELAIIVFDLADKSSYEHVESWREFATNEIGERKCIIVGNKSDIPQSLYRVDANEAKSKCEKGGISYFLTSAKSGNGIRELFTEIARRLAGSHDDDLEGDEISFDTMQSTNFNLKKHGCKC